MSDTDRDKLVQIIDTWLTDPDVPPSDRLADAILAEFLPEHDKKVKADAWKEGAKRQWGYGQKSIPNEYVPNPYRSDHERAGQAER